MRKITNNMQCVALGNVITLDAFITLTDKHKSYYFVIVPNTVIN